MNPRSFDKHEGKGYITAGQNKGTIKELKKPRWSADLFYLYTCHKDLVNYVGKYNAAFYHLSISYAIMMVFKYKMTKITFKSTAIS